MVILRFCSDFTPLSLNIKFLAGNMRGAGYNCFYCYIIHYFSASNLICNKQTECSNRWIELYVQRWGVVVVFNALKYMGKCWTEMQSQNSCTYDEGIVDISEIRFIRWICYVFHYYCSSEGPLSLVYIYPKTTTVTTHPILALSHLIS